MRRVIGEPLLVGQVPEPVIASLQMSLSPPPPIPLGDHVQSVRAPLIEIPHDAHRPHIGPEELELDDAIPGYACHLLMPFVTMPSQSLCQRGTDAAIRALMAKR